MLSSRLGTCFSAWLVLDTEEIEKFCKSLSISEDDGKVVSLDRSLVLLGKRQMQNYLVGKILTNKKANMEAFKAVIHDVWKTVKIDHIYQFESQYPTFTNKMSNQLFTSFVFWRGQ